MGSTLGKMRGPQKKGISIIFGIGSDCGVLFERNSIPPIESATRKGVSQSTRQGVSFGA